MSLRIPHFRQVSGFSLVELIVVVTILAILSVVGVTYGNNYKLSQYNVRRISDIKTLKNATESYMAATKTLPPALGNRQYYDKKGNYIHDSKIAFGVSTYITPDTLPREYLQTFPLDPQTNHYYTYGSRLDGTLHYEFATVINDGGEYSTYLRGNYDGTPLASLIKEFNGPNFVDDGTVDYLPYNPEELKVTGRIVSWSGTITRNNAPFTDAKTLLGQDDIITVSTGGLAQISLSDGSELELGSTISESSLKFDTLKYNEDNNLSSQVEAVLTMGEVWVRAPKYYEKSGFSIAVDGQAATVRGTVFGVKKIGAGKTITLGQGRIEVGNTKDGASGLQLPDDFGTGFTSSLDSRSITMDTTEGGKPISLGEYCEPSKPDYCHIKAEDSEEDNLASANKSLTKDIGVHSGRIPEVLEFTKTGGIVAGGADRQLIIKLANFGANEIELTASGGQTFTGSANTGSGIIILESRDASLLKAANLTIRLCYDPAKEHLFGDRRCSGYKNISLPESNEAFSFSGKVLEVASTTDNACASGSVNWGTLGCQDAGLIAYAKYDAINDTTGNKDTSLGLFQRNGQTLPVDTTLANSERTSFESCTTAGANGQSQCNIPYVPVPSIWPWTSSGIFLTDSQTTFPSGWSPMSSYDTWSLASRVRLWQSLGFQINPYNNIWRLPDGTTGAYIDNYGSGDYLRYDLSPLDLGDRFAIEIGVRGAALKRMGNYFLFTLLNNGVQGLRGYITNTGNIKIMTNTSNIQTPALSTLGISDTNLYLIQYKQIGGTGSVSITDGNNNVLAPMSANIQGNTSGNIYIGSNFSVASQTSTQQWNDIISSFRIYSLK